MDLASILISVCLMAVGWLIHSITALMKTSDNVESKVNQIHDWMSPDDKGRQAWKDMSPLLIRMDQTNKTLDRLCVLLEKQLEKG
jgi:hypothetical protein